MEELIQKTLLKLKIEYALFWALPILVIILGECDMEWAGLYADNVRVSYISETVGILAAASCVPLALKLFSWILLKKIDVVSFPEALKLYFDWSSIRLLILEVALLINILTYYLTLSNTGLLCALIVLTASLFCVPGEKRLRGELHINKGDSI